MIFSKLADAVFNLERNSLTDPGPKGQKGGKKSGFPGIPEFAFGSSTSAPVQSSTAVNLASRGRQPTKVDRDQQKAEHPRRIPLCTDELSLTLDDPMHVEKLISGLSDEADAVQAEAELNLRLNALSDPGPKGRKSYKPLSVLYRAIVEAVDCSGDGSQPANTPGTSVCDIQSPVRQWFRTPSPDFRPWTTPGMLPPTHLLLQPSDSEKEICALPSTTAAMQDSSRTAGPLPSWSHQADEDSEKMPMAVWCEQWKLCHDLVRTLSEHDVMEPEDLTELREDDSGDTAGGPAMIFSKLADAVSNLERNSLTDPGPKGQKGSKKC